MATTLIVLAHPERRSFNGAWAAASARAVEAAGKRVILSDLYAQDFDPREAAHHYAPQTGPFDPLKAQETAAAQGCLPRDVAEEVAKVRAAEAIVLHFPLWWFGPPAILKGWADRVFVHGSLHDVDHRFDTGLCPGKRVLFCVTTGASEAESGYNGKEGDVRMLLWPLAYAFRYLGFTVLDPEVVHGVHGYYQGAEKAELETRLKAVLAAQDGVIAGLANRPAIDFNSDTDFDDRGRLRPGRPSHSPFIRQKK